MARKSRKFNNDTPDNIPMRTLFRVAAYIRLSVEDNRKRGDSVETQKSIIESHIALMPGLQIHDFYVDNGTTGTNLYVFR